MCACSKTQNPSVTPMAKACTTIRARRAWNEAFVYVVLLGVLGTAACQKHNLPPRPVPVSDDSLAMRHLQVIVKDSSGPARNFRTLLDTYAPQDTVPSKPLVRSSDMIETADSMYNLQIVIDPIHRINTISFLASRPMGKPYGSPAGSCTGQEYFTLFIKHSRKYFTNQYVFVNHNTCSVGYWYNSIMDIYRDEVLIGRAIYIDDVDDIGKSRISTSYIRPEINVKNISSQENYNEDISGHYGDSTYLYNKFKDEF